MGKKDQLFDIAVTLRTEGKTLAKIGERIGVSTNTLSKWFKNEGIEELRHMVETHPLSQIERVDRSITKIFIKIEQTDGEMTPAQIDSLSKLMKIRERLAKPGSDDLLRSVVVVCSKLAKFAEKYYENHEDRKTLGGLLKAFFTHVRKEMEM
ncbi:MAG: helix-turn-helix domain-containing protein [Candidatus Aminicenantes bacterium]|nr:helix-turn-helix domain-containing protein [Candidatus Aminicenantes bacterium]